MLIKTRGTHVYNMKLSKNNSDQLYNKMIVQDRTFFLYSLRTEEWTVGK